MRTIFTLLTLSILTTPLAALAEDCSSYPYQDGLTTEPVEGGVKLLSTASVDVPFDDISSVNAARMEAELAAKAKISKFLNEEIKSEEAIDSLVNTTQSIQGKEKVSKQDITKSIKNLTTISSASLVKGIVYLAQCVTPGKELRYTVGIKPETIAGADALASNLQAGGSHKDGATGAVGNAVSVGKNQLQPVAGFSDTSKLNNF